MTTSHTGIAAYVSEHRFRLTLGNSNVTLRINGRNRSVLASDGPINYDITRARGRRPLAAASRPSCSA